MEAKILASYSDAVLHEAMRRYGILAGEIQPLAGFESFIYAYQHGDTRRILRVTHSLHRDEAAIRGEVDWLRYLAENDVCVAHALPSFSGSFVEVLGAGREYFSATAYRFAPGSPPRRADWDNRLALQLGQMLGRMNRLARDYHPLDPRARRPHILEDMSGFERFLPPGEEAVAEKYRQMLAALTELPTASADYGMVHQDAHGGNFHLQDGKITLFDFDDCLYAWYAYDVAMALFYCLPHDCRAAQDVERARRTFGELMEGYCREHDLSASMQAQIPRFLKQREIDLYIAIHRSLDLNNLDPWCASFMTQRREKILQDIPYVEMRFA